MARPIFIPGDQILIDPYDVKPLKEFELKKDFPNCCNWHKSVKETAENWFEKFPNCCDEHIKDVKRIPNFNKANYKHFIDKITFQIAYTEHVISSRINNDDWLQDIADYIEYNFYSFGHPDFGCHAYMHILCEFFKVAKNIPEDKRQILISHYTPPANDDKLEQIDVNKLFNTYDKWLRLFPFELSYLNISKENIAKSIPILEGKPVVNRYTGISKSKLITPVKLIEFLHDLTKHLLGSIDPTELFAKGLIHEPKKARIEILNANHRLATSDLLNEYSAGERKYIKTMKKWLELQKSYFSDISELITEPIKTEEKPIDKLTKELCKYGLTELPKVKKLSDAGRQQLFSLLTEQSVPYKIAMLDHLDFIGSAITTHFGTKFKLQSFLASLFHVTERDIKGHLNVLNPVSNENRKRYTAHVHKETVKKDYENIK